MTKTGIYALTNTKTGKKYVGQSIDIGRRMVEHSKGKEPFAIGRAISKYGWDSFEVEVLELCDRESLNEREIAWIEQLRTTSPNGYNMTTGGGQGMQVTDDVRKKISEATRNGLTPEVIALRASKIRGRPKSEEWKKAMSERQRNPENVARIAAMARNMSDETRAKISNAKLGHKKSEETKERISAVKRADKSNTARLAELARSMSPETRAKMSAAAKSRCARRDRDVTGKFV